MREEPSAVRRSRFRWLTSSPARTAVVAFAGTILLGAIVLSLPISSAEGKWTSPVDALFTATSAVCVTGLIVKDTPHYWSLFGQIVILVLIQAGGLGIMTVYALLATVVFGRLSLGMERMMGDMVEAHPTENIWDLVRFICRLTLVAEAAGAILLFFSWRGSFESPLRCFYFSVFHAISAFCNAGFSLYSDSLVRYRSNISVNLVVGSLIVVGGLGFLVLRDLKGYAEWWLAKRRGKRPRLTTHSKLVLAVTGLLLTVGFCAILAMESTFSLRGAPWKERILAAAFQAVTPRTAGFSTMPMGIGTLAPPTLFLLIVLMFLGGSPGSTAGGIKTTTLGVMAASILATLRGSDRAEMFHHSIHQETVHRVASVILLSLAALVGGTFLLLITESGASFLEVAFEATSAFGTVGLSLGLTPELTVPGRLIIPALMFVGRLGPVTIVLSAATVQGKLGYRYPTAHVMVG